MALCRTCRFALAGPAPRAVLGWAEGGVVAAVPFTGRVRDVILGFKYRNRRQLAGHLAGLLVNRLVAEGIRPGRDVDVVTWAPTSSGSPAPARLRPGRTGRPPGRPPTGPAVAPAARANHQHRASDRSRPRPSAGRSVVRGPSQRARSAGACRRRRRHHRVDVAGRGRHPARRGSTGCRAGCRRIDAERSVDPWPGPRRTVAAGRQHAAAPPFRLTALPGPASDSTLPRLGDVPSQK